MLSMSVPQHQDWKPRRHRDRYCSPACGAGCTRAAFDAATHKAAMLAKAMGGKWKPRVWENMGWFWEARLVLPNGGHVEITQDKLDRKFRCRYTSGTGIQIFHSGKRPEACAR